MREDEVHALLHAHAGESICISYRTRSDGSIATRSEPARRWLAPALAGLAACSTPRASTSPDDAAASATSGSTLPAATVQPPGAPQPAKPFEVRVNFAVDPHQSMVRGSYPVPARRHDRLHWIPTETLWNEFVARVRARRARSVPLREG